MRGMESTDREVTVPSVSELQGELVTLNALVAALIAVQPLSAQLMVWPVFEMNLERLRGEMDPGQRVGLERVAVTVKRLSA